MNNQNIALVSQLLDSMNLALQQLEKAMNNRDIEKFNLIKKEILKFQVQINEVLV